MEKHAIAHHVQGKVIVKTKLFVFGTLKQGYGLNRFLTSSKFLGEVELEGYDLYEMSNGIPFIIKGEGVVYGEIYEVNEEILGVLDSIEVGYDRVKEKVLLLGEMIEINAYTFDRIVNNSIKLDEGVY